MRLVEARLGLAREGGQWGTLWLQFLSATPSKALVEGIVREQKIDDRPKCLCGGGVNIPVQNIPE